MRITSNGFRLIILFFTALIFFHEEAYGTPNPCFVLDCPDVTTLAATELSADSAKLKGEVNPNSIPTNAWFKWGTASGVYDYETSPQTNAGEGNASVPYEFTLSELTCETTYYYQAYAYSEGGGVGDEVSFTTLACLPDPPSVSTSTANPVSETSATLVGYVNPNGSATTAWFKWGPTTTTVNETAPKTNAGDGTDIQSFNFPLSGLNCGTTYYFKAIANNAGGTVEGDQDEFTTSACPAIKPSAVTGGADSIGPTNATLNGTANPNGSATQAAFEWGLTTSYELGTTLPTTDVGSGTTAQSFSYGLTSLVCGTTYYFRAVASNAGGQDLGGQQSFTTLDCPPTVVTAEANAVGQYGATLNGTVNPNGSATTAWFKWGPTTDTDNVTSPTTNAGSATTSSDFSYALTDLACGTTYYFIALANNGGGTVEGERLSFVTGACPPTATTSQANPVSQYGATLNGTVNPNGSLTTAWFNWGPTTDIVNTTSPATNAGAGSSANPFLFVLSGLECGTTYYVKAFASNDGGTDEGDRRSFETRSCPAAPTVVTNNANPVGQSSARLNGTVDPNGFDTDAWFEWGETTSYENGETPRFDAGAGSLSKPFSYPLPNLECGTTYYFRAVAESEGGRTEGGRKSLTTQDCPPTAVTNSASAIGQYSATLNGTVNPNGSATTARFKWGPTTGTNNVTSPETDAGAGTSATSFSYPLTNLECNTTYYFRATASNDGGSDEGDLASFKTTECPPATPDVTTGAANAIGRNSATLNGTVNPNGLATTAWFQWGLTTSYGQTTSPVAAGSGNSAVPFATAINGLECGIVYQYRAVANGDGALDYGLNQQFTTLLCPIVPPDPPTGVAASDDVYTDRIRVTWNSSTGADNYEVWRSTTDNTDSAVSVSTFLPTGTIWDDTSAVPGITYYYWVRACNVIAGCSGFSSSDPGSVKLLVDPGVTVGNVSALPGEKISLPLTFGNNGSVVAFDVALSYDPNTLGLSSFSCAEDVVGSFFSNCSSDQAGEIRFNFLNDFPYPPLSSGTFGMLEFIINSDAPSGDVPVTVTFSDFANKDAIPVITPVAEGAVNVGALPLFSDGFEAYQNLPEKITIAGPEVVYGNYNAQFLPSLQLKNGAVPDSNLAGALWSISPDTFGAINEQGLLSSIEVSEDKKVSINLAYEQDGVTLYDTFLTTLSGLGDGTIRVKSGFTSLSGNEGEVVIVYLERVGGSSGQISTTYSTTDVGTLPADYTDVSVAIGTLPSTGSVTWADGDVGDKVVGYWLTDDNWLEAKESFQFMIEDSPVTIEPRVSTIEINRNDNIHFAAGPASAQEGVIGGAVSVPVNRSGGELEPGSAPITLRCFTGRGSAPVAERDVDYQTGCDGFSYGPGDPDPTMTVYFIDDAEFEEDENFIASPTGPVAQVTTSRGTVTILDDDEQQAAAIIVTDDEYSGGSIPPLSTKVTSEYGDSDTFWVELASRPTTDVVIELVIGDGSEGSFAGFGVEDTSIGLYFPQNDWNAGKEVRVYGLDDFDFDGPEQYNIAVTSYSNGDSSYDNLAGPSVSVINEDNDTAGVIGFETTNYSGSEGQIVNLFVRRIEGASGSVSVDYSISSGTASNSDYQGLAGSFGSLTWTNGDTSSKVISISLTDDNWQEPAETFTVQLSNLTGGAVFGGLVTAEVVINQNDWIQFNVSSVSRQEGDGGLLPVNVTVNRTGGDLEPGSQSISVDCFTIPGPAPDATPGIDYESACSGFTYGPGDPNPTVTVNIIGDTEFEDNENFIVAPTGFPSQVTGGSGVVTILDDDFLEVQSVISMGSPTVQGNEGSIINVIVNRTSSSDGEVSVSYNLIDLSTIPNDYQDTSGLGGIVSWADGDTDPKFITFFLTDDNWKEGNETFRVELQPISDVIVDQSRSYSDVTILANDFIHFDVASASVEESGGVVNLAVTPSGGELEPGSAPITATCLTKTGPAPAATRDVDYDSTCTGFSFAPGDSFATMTAYIFDDGDAEDDENFIVAATGFPAQVTNTSGVVTIIDDDTSTSVVRVKSGFTNVFGSEGEVIEIYLERIGGSSGEASVFYDLFDETAVWDDYQDISGIGGVVTWSDGDVNDKVIAIQLVDDQDPEGDETFRLELQPVNEVIIDPASDTANVVIEDNDEYLEFQVESVWQTEGGFGEYFVQVPVYLNIGSVSGGPVELECSTFPGPFPEANPDGGSQQDYDPFCENVVFFPGDNIRYVTVRIFGDFSFEQDERFTIELSETTGNPNIATYSGVYTIINDD